MLVPKFFTVSLVGRGAVRLHTMCNLLERGSREPMLPAQRFNATIDTETRKWKDSFPTLQSALVVSERVAKAMIQAELSGIELFQVTFVDIPPALAKKVSNGSYYWTRLHGGIDLDSQFAWEQGTRQSEWEMVHRAVPLPDSWGGEDLFHTVIGWPMPGLLCTRRFVEFARRLRWEELRFFPMDTPRPVRDSHSAGVEYLQKTCPPKWYPDDVEPHPSNLEEVEYE